MLESHGYTGTATRTAPRHEGLKKSFNEITNTAGLLPGTGASGDQYLPLESVAGREVAYHQRLLADFHRAAPETDRSIRNDGVSGVRAVSNSYQNIDGGPASLSVSRSGGLLVGTSADRE